MDPLSITAAAIGITQFALSQIIQLHDTIDKLHAVKEELRDIHMDLGAIRFPLRALEDIVIENESGSRAAKEDLEKTGIAKAVNQCGDACKDFDKSLRKWTNHSTDTRLSARDRLVVGLWRKEKIATFRSRVKSCRETVHFAVASAQLIVQLRSGVASANSHDEIKMQLSTLQTEILQHLSATNEEQRNTRQRLEELTIERDADETDDAQRDLAIAEVKSRSKLLENDQVCKGVIYTQIRSHITQQSIEDVITSAESSAMVGIPEAVVGKINLRIRSVHTTDRSKAVVGVFPGGFKMEEFF